MESKQELSQGKAAVNTVGFFSLMILSRDILHALPGYMDWRSEQSDVIRLLEAPILGISLVAISLKIMLGQESYKEYSGCTDFDIMSNFDLELGASVTPTAIGLTIAPASKWSAWIDGNNFLLATGNSYKKRRICVKVKDAAIVKADPKKEITVAFASILVRPIATP